jgi:hypothetical protein
MMPIMLPDLLEPPTKFGGYAPSLSVICMRCAV